MAQGHEILTCTISRTCQPFVVIGKAVLLSLLCLSQAYDARSVLVLLQVHTQRWRHVEQRHCGACIGRVTAAAGPLANVVRSMYLPTRF